MDSNTNSSNNILNDEDKKETEDSFDLKRIRTLDTDTKEYKEKLRKYGEEQTLASNQLRETEDKTHLGETQNEENGEDGEENIPFVELLKNKKKSHHNEYAPVYDPNITSANKQKVTRVFDDNTKSNEAGEEDYEMIDLAQSNEPDDEKTALRKKISELNKEYENFRARLESYQKDQSRVLDERDGLVSKKSEMEKIIQPILEQEKKLESEIKKIEEEEEIIHGELERREKEQERWLKEDERQKIERQKWAHMEDLDVVSKFIEDKNKIYQSLIDTEREAELKLSSVEKAKETKEAELKLLDIVRLKSDIETNKIKLTAQIKKFEETIRRLEKSEKSIILEKKAIEDKEHLTKDPAEEKLMENKRWEMEDKLRKVEQEKWQITDKKERLLEIMSDIEQQHNKILLEEKESLSKAGKRPHDS